MSAPWNLWECRLQHCVNEDDDELCCSRRRDDVVSCWVSITDSLGRQSCVSSGTCENAGWGTVLMRKMTSCVSRASASDGRKAAEHLMFWRFLYSWVHLQLPQRLGSPPAYEGGQWGAFEWTLFGDIILIGPCGWETQLERSMQSRLCVQRMSTWWSCVMHDGGDWVCIWSAVIRSMSHVCWMMSLD